MDHAEEIVFEYLKKIFTHEVIIHEPDGNIPPDIAINSVIGVEVTRLNQNFFDSRETEALRKLDSDLYAAFRDVLKSFNAPSVSNKSFYVYLQYKRPLNHTIYQTKKDMKRILSSFIDSDSANLPYDIRVNSAITFTLYKRQLNDGKLFVSAGSYDDDAGGEFSVYARNIAFCINEKSSKVSIHLEKYSQWWLYLVDRIGYTLDENEISQIIKMVGTTGNFDKVVLLSANGNSVIATISK